MKNVIMGLLGCYVMVFLALIGACIYTHSVRKNELENALSAVMEQTMNQYYEKRCQLLGQEIQSQETIEAKLKEELLLRIWSDSQLEVVVDACDMKKGLLSVRVKACYQYPGGQQGKIQHKKTIIMDRKVWDNELLTITFWDGDRLYKQFEITQKEALILPSAPEQGNFLGWSEKGKTAVIRPADYRSMEKDLEFVAVYQD